MSISEKTRKQLWALSGNCCAICKESLVNEEGVVIGEECHIISGKPNGPRYSFELQTENLDLYENLIALCSIHHKVVDEKTDHYPPEKLRQIKQEHENWIKSKVRNIEVQISPKIKYKPGPYVFKEIQKGPELTNMALGVHSSCHSFGEIDSDDDLRIIADFFQLVFDYGEGLDGDGVSAIVEAGIEIGKELKKINEMGYSIFGRRINMRIEGGIEPPSNWSMIYLMAVKSSDSQIFTHEKGFKAVLVSLNLN